MILIDFILDGVRFAARTWTAVPRVGDTVILKKGEVWAEVTWVAWSDASAAFGLERQWVQIGCKTVVDPTIINKE